MEVTQRLETNYLVIKLKIIYISDKIKSIYRFFLIPTATTDLPPATVDLSPATVDLPTATVDLLGLPAAGGHILEPPAEPRSALLPSSSSRQYKVGHMHCFFFGAKYYEGETRAIAFNSTKI